MGKPDKRLDTLPKADKKIEKKVQFYAKVRDTVASLSTKNEIAKKTKGHRRQNKLKAFDLSALSELLPELEASQGPVSLLGYSKLNRRRKQKLILEEGKKLSNVLNHPAFQADPVGSILQHLQSTQPVMEEALAPQKKRNKNGSKKKKKKGTASSQPESMETS